MINVYVNENRSHRDWTWHDVFKQLTLYMKEKYSANIIVHDKDGLFFVEKYNLELRDSDLIIEDTDVDSLKILSFAEGPSPSNFLSLMETRNNEKDILSIAQFFCWIPKHYDASTFKFKLKSSSFYTFDPKTNYDYWYRLRQWDLLKNGMDQLTDDRMFSLPDTLRGDTDELHRRGVVCDPIRGITLAEYLNKAIKHKIGLAMSGAGEICHKEIEYMAIGLPFIRLEYMTQMTPPLIPNYHYIAIPRDNFPWDTNAELRGGPEYVEAYINRFNEVKDDNEFLQFIAKNAREYYETYCRQENRLQNLTNILEL